MFWNNNFLGKIYVNCFRKITVYELMLFSVQLLFILNICRTGLPHSWECQKHVVMCQICTRYLLSYLYNLLQVYHPSRSLRSSTQQLLRVSYMSTDFGWRAFSYSSPATWNSIPISIKNCSSLYSFKRHLKSYFIAQLTNNKYTPSGHLVTARASDSCLMLDYMCAL